MKQIPAGRTAALVIALALSGGLARPAAGSGALPAKTSLYPLYSRYGLVAQAQRGDTCWAYSIIGCLELELSRSRKAPTTLSPFYLIWAAARADNDTIDPRGSNFGRAARALERFGVAARDTVAAGNESASLSAELPEQSMDRASSLGRGVEIEWLRFWRNPPGWTEPEMELVKRRLAAGHPVAVGMRWPKQLTIEDKDLCLLGTCRSLDDTFDGHCVTLVGYEDGAQYPGGGVFLIRNTWGPEWMQEGYGRMSYAYMRSFANDALSFSVNSNAQASGSSRRPPSNSTDLPAVVPTAAECQADEGVRITDEEMARFRKGAWQADRQVLCSTAGPAKGIRMEIRVPQAGRYGISIAATKAPDYGTWQVKIDDKPIGAQIDFGWPNVEPTGELRLGAVQLSAGKHSIRFECRGKSPASSGFLLGLNWVRLQPESAQKPPPSTH